MIRLAVVGCAGGRGYWFAAQAAREPGFTVTALVDEIPEAARAVAAELGLSGAGIYSSVEQAVRDRTCDAVLVATPDGQHAGAAIPALEAGLYVYVEKPLEITAEACARIAAADRAAGGKTMVGFNLRFAPFYRRMRELSRDGRVGRILTIQADEFYYGGRTYFRRWNRLRSAGGGLWITKACHDFDILGWIAGAAPLRVSAQTALTHYRTRAEAGTRCSACPIEARCPDSALPELRGEPPLWTKIRQLRDASPGWAPRDLCLYNSDKDTFDHGIAQVTFEEDITAVYTLNVVAAFSDRRMTIAGTEGTLDGSLASPQIRYWRRHREAQAPELVPVAGGQATDGGGHGGADEHLLGEFAAFVHGEPSVAVAPPEATVAVAMGLAATRSADSNRVVEMSEIPGWADLRGAMRRA